jgi:hypothetical protein
VNRQKDRNTYEEKTGNMEQKTGNRKQGKAEEEESRNNTHRNTFDCLL